MAVDPVAAYGPIRPVDRDVLNVLGQGLISETIPRLSTNAGTAVVDGTIYFVGIGLTAGDLVTNISIVVTGSVASGMTVSKVGLYTTAGVLLASSADQALAWETTGMKTIAMSTPYRVVTNGMYYLALIAKATVTLPSISRSSTQSVTQMLAVGTGKMPLGTQTGQTDLVTPATIAAGSGLPFWMGVS